MKTVAVRLSGKPHRIGRFYTGRPSWRTRLRALRRRLGESELPRSDEERLLDAALALRRGAGGAEEQVRALRIVRPLPLVFLAADGRTTFRYGQALKNASSSVLYMLLQITGEAAYYPWDEHKHFLNIQRVWRQREWMQRIRAMAKEQTADAGSLVINEEQMRLHQYAPSPYYSQRVHPPSDIRFCLVRDPVERFVSAYQQMVLNPYRTVRGKAANTFTESVRSVEERKQLLDIDSFIAEKEAQKQACKKGNLHFRPQKWFLGDADYYTHIFSVHQLEEVRDFLSELAQKPLALPNINRTRRKREILAEHPAARGLNLIIPPLTAQQRRRIETLYAEDYEAFGRYF